MELDITIRNATQEQAETLLLAFNAVNKGQVTRPDKVEEKTAGASATSTAPQTEPSLNNTGATPVVHTNGPAAGTTESPVALLNAETDARGIKWDERIHSASRVKNADGNWKKRKNVKPEETETVENEQRAASASQQFMPNFNAAEQQQAPVANAVTPQPLLNNGVVVNTAVAGTPVPNFNAPADNGNMNDIPLHLQQPQAQTQVQQPQAQTQVQQPQAQTHHVPQGSDFAALMTRFNNATSAGKIDGMYGVGLCAKLSHKHGTTLSSITDLMNRPVMITDALEMMTQDGI